MEPFTEALKKYNFYHPAKLHHNKKGLSHVKGLFFIICSKPKKKLRFYCGHT